jgi:tRNA pseudouridine38-40 synthase
MRTIALTLAYVGTRYVGWQRQPVGVSIQGLVETAISAIEQRPVIVRGAGRTDAGVHAIGQVASLSLQHPIPCETLQRALNARLPDDVRVTRVAEKGSRFDARFSAVAKTYRYVIAPVPVPDPFDAPYAWHVPVRLDVRAMSEALERLRGTHDFAAFCGAGSDVTTTTRTLFDVSCREVDEGVAASWRPVATGGPRLVIALRGNGFLRHMVRNIAGTLVEIGKGRWPVSFAADVLATRDRRQAGPTAPAHGLCLVEVEYPDE